MPSHEYLALLERMKDLHIRKSAGYAGKDNPDPWANFRYVEETLNMPAELGVMVRMSDKWRRMLSLMSDPDNEQVGEALEDTMMDLASYVLIYICLMHERCDTLKKV